MSQAETFRDRPDPSPRAVLTRRHSGWKVAAMVLGVTCVALIFLGGLLAVGIWRGWPQRLSAEDREVLLTAAELAPHYEFVLRSDGEQFAKTRFFPGREELYYRYEHPDLAAPFQIACRIVVAPTRVEARAVYQQFESQLETAGAAEDWKFEEGDSFPWGDAFRSGMLRSDVGVAGHVLACRMGEKVVFLELLGVGLEDSQWAEMTAAALQSLESYQP